MAKKVIAKAKHQRRTLVGFVLDETGSMEGVKDSTISGFNEYLDTLKRRGDSISFTLIQFNSGKIKTIYDDVPIDETAHLNDDTYKPDNMTPLYDAIAKGIKSIEKKREKILDECDDCEARFSCFTGDIKKDCDIRPAVLFVIMTDGFENASIQYNRAKIFELIGSKEKEEWTFAYLGANQDAWEVGTSLGVSGASTFTYDATSDMGISKVFAVSMAATEKYLDDGSTYTSNFFDDSKIKKSRKKK